MAEWASQMAGRKLIVLEPDAVSSAALRVLDRQLGEHLKTANTRQVFNKLTETERPIYERVSGGTLFPNLPPLPFDWQVRASFSLGNILGMLTRDSAFGLAALRIVKALIPQHLDEIVRIEKSTVGEWFEEINDRLSEHDAKKRALGGR